MMQQPAAPATSPKKLELRYYQDESLKALDDFYAAGGRRALIVLPTGAGKAEPLDEPVLTPAGWRPIGDLAVGDAVIGSNGLPTRILGVYPQGVQQCRVVRFSDGASVRCSPEHLWAVATRGHLHENRTMRRGRTTPRPYRVLTTAQIEEEGLRDKGNGLRHYLPLMRPACLDTMPLPLDPYTLGVLLGDGGMSGTQVCLDTDDEIAASLPLPDGSGAHRTADHGQGIGHYNIVGTGGHNGNTCREALRSLGLLGCKSIHKFIPDMYLLGNPEDRLALLQGLMDTDGWASGGARAEFSTSSAGLREGFMALVRSLGGTCTSREKLPVYTYKGERRIGMPSYTITPALPDSMCPFRLERKRSLWTPRTSYQPRRAIVAVGESAPCEMVCIAVDAPDSLFVTKDYVLTHNTIVFAEALRRRGGRTLVMAHRDELIEQAAAKVARVINGSDDDLARIGIVKAERNEIDNPIVVASVQTIQNASRCMQLGKFDTIVVDEAHHATSVSYRNVLTWLGAFAEGGPVLLGVTATPDRLDGVGMHNVFEKIVYNLGMEELIDRGILADLRAIQVELALGLDDVATSHGDFSEKSLDRALRFAHAPKHAYAAWDEHAQGMKTIGFWPSVEMATDAAEMWTSRGVAAEVLSHKTPKDVRRAMLIRFASGETKIIHNMGVLTEGFDSEDVECILMARPTKGRALYQQCLDAETEILTPTGWAGMGEIHIGDMIAGFDTNTGSVAWLPALSVVARPLCTDERMYGLATPHVDVRVTGGHRMVYRHVRGNVAWKIQEAHYLAKRSDSYAIPVSGHQDAPGVPLSDAELRFIGWFLTDGSLDRRTDAISISRADHRPYHGDIVACLEGCGLKYDTYTQTTSNFNRTSPVKSYHVSKDAPRGTDTHLRGWGHLSPYIDKDLSPLLESMDRRQLGVLLETMHFADGAKQRGQSRTQQSYHINKGNRPMLERLQSLCVRRGYRCSIATRETSGKPLYTAHIKDTTTIHVGGTRAKDRGSLVCVDAVVGEHVWCAENSLGTLITRRRGKVSVVGNCVGRGTRKCPTKTECLILDVVDATTTHKLVTTASLFGLDIKEVAEKGVSEARKAELMRRLQRANEAEAAQISREISLFQTERMVWRKDGEGFKITIPEGFLAVERNGAGRYDVRAQTSKGSTGLASDLDLGYAQGVAEDHIRGLGGKVRSNTGTAPWKIQKASPAQVKLLTALGAAFDAETLSAGEATALTNAHFAKRG